jgi:hypothetical protein
MEEEAQEAAVPALQESEGQAVTHAELLASCSGGIIFTGESVRGIRDGMKTRTMRAMKPQPSAGIRKSPFSPSGIEDGHGRPLKPRYQPGKRYYIKEAYNYFDPDPAGDDAIAIPKERFFNRAPWSGVQGAREIRWTSVYACDGPIVHPKDGRALWRPSCLMPRWAARYAIEIVDVTPMRLQDVTIEQAIAEGVPQTYGDAVMQGFIDPKHDKTEPHEWDNRTSVENLAVLWDRINGKRAPWARNPWVWSYSFRLVTP